MQNTTQLLMIQPVNFGFNEQTAVNNSFQKNISGDIQQNALQEFNDFVKLLRENKVDVTVVEDSVDPATPDSVFPNNWISFHSNGCIYLYPMFAVNRRRERKAAVLDAIKAKFHVADIIDFTAAEGENLFLEGTGSMVLDRDNKIAYACLSPRTNEGILHQFCKLADFTAVTFMSTDSSGNDIYHTNVMMCVADKYAVICLQSIRDDEQRKKVIASLAKTNKAIIDISLQQLNHFAGNMLQVINTDGKLHLIMSTQAFQSLTTAQIETLERFNPIIHASLNTIESAGGGSARCMMAEVFLQRK